MRALGRCLLDDGPQRSGEGPHSVLGEAAQDPMPQGGGGIGPSSARGLDREGRESQVCERESRDSVADTSRHVQGREALRQVQQRRLDESGVREGLQAQGTEGGARGCANGVPRSSPRNPGRLERRVTWRMR